MDDCRKVLLKELAMVRDRLQMLKGVEDGLARAIRIARRTASPTTED